jgi:hypothetical protein
VPSPKQPLTQTQTRLRQAAVVTGLGMLAGAPYLYYLSAIAQRAGVGARLRTVSVQDLLTSDFSLLVLLLAMTSLVGCFLSRRYQLPGLGTLRDLRRAAAPVLVGGLALGAATYLLFGRRFATLVPGYYPTSVVWALVLPFKAALVEEPVARFGMMTILAGLVRRPWAANLAQAVFFTALNLKTLAFFGVAPGALAYAGLALTFAAHLGFGAMYARYGLVAAAATHFVVDLKFVVHALLT